MAIFQPKMLVSSTREPKSTKGEEIRKEKDTPKGRPALVNPMNKGMEEQEQNGVTVPSKAESALALMPLYLPNILRVRCGGK